MLAGGLVSAARAAALAVLFALGLAAGARAQGQGPIRIGLLDDQSGEYSDIMGKGSIEAAKMAIEDHGGKVLGRPVELLVGDHLNKPDVGGSIVREWFDQKGVELVTEVGHSAVALAVQEIARQKKKIVIFGAVGTTEVTRKACSPYGVAWLYDAHALTAGTAEALVKQGLDTWFFLTVDYNFGHSMQEESSKAVLANGGKVLGAVRFPQNTGDFSSFLLQAQASKAKVVSLIASGSDNINGIKQIEEFGLTQQGQTVTIPLLWITDVNRMGLKLAHGLTFIETFYWDRNDETRAWSKRFFARHPAMPTGTQVSVYSGIRHWLKAVEAAGTVDSDAVMAKMKEIPVNDVYVKNGTIREDMHLMHDFYLAQVKKPEEQKGPWDYYKILATIPADHAYAPLSESPCPLVKK